MASHFCDVKSGLESTIDKNRLTCMLKLLQPTKFYLSIERPARFSTHKKTEKNGHKFNGKSISYNGRFKYENTNKGFYPYLDQSAEVFQIRECPKLFAGKSSYFTK